MSNVIERVASILAERDGTPHMPEYRKRAARIVAAMREPDDAMTMAIVNASSPGDLAGLTIWRAGIDAALAPH